MDKYNFQIIPPHSGKIKQLRIEGSRLRWLIFAVGAFLFINITLLVVNFVFLSDVSKSHELSNTNEKLSAQLDDISRHADSLAFLIGEINILQQDVRGFADLPPLSEAEFSYGIGGPELNYLDPDKPIILARAKDIGRKLDSLLVAAKAENKALVEAGEHFEKKASIFSKTPSIWPMRGYVSSGFGKRLDPFTGVWKMHEGIDICARKGTPIRATANGRVRFSGWYHGYGKMVRINHTYYETRYGHLDDIKVRPGQQVKRGDIIGTCGNSGRTTGVHLHYEVRLSGKPVDPKKYILPEVVVD